MANEDKKDFNAMGWIVVTVLSVMPLIIVELQKFVSSFVWRKD